MASTFDNTLSTLEGMGVDFTPGGAAGGTGAGGASLAQTSGAGSLASQLGTLTAQGNLNALPYDQQLSSVINQTNQLAQQQANNSRIPGEAGLEQQSSDDISAQLAGNLAPGTVSGIQDSMAQRYGSAGFGEDSAAISAAAERAMGLTAEQQVAAGQSGLTAATARNPSAPIFDMSNLMVSPGQYSQTAMQEAALRQAAARNSAGGGTGGTGAVGTTTAPRITGAQGPASGGNTAATGGTGRSGTGGGNVGLTGSTGAVPTLPDGSPDYTQPFNYTTPGGSSLVWTGQDWSSLFGDPYSSTGTTSAPYDPASFNDPGFGTDLQYPGWNPYAGDTGYNYMPDYSINNPQYQTDPMAGLVGTGDTGGYTGGDTSGTDYYGMDSSWYP